MGRNVLATSFVGTKKIRAYAHCSKNSPGITLLIINLDETTAVEVHLSVANAISNTKLTLEPIAQQTRKTKYTNKYRQDTEAGMMREEYHLTAKDGDLHSQTMLLNGEILAVDSSGEIPPLEPRRVNSSAPITVAPHSILFAQMPYTQVPACK